MDLAERSEWTAALRSGEYPQGSAALCNVNDEYCCLGLKALLDNRLKEKDPFYGRQTIQGSWHYYYGRIGELDLPFENRAALPDTLRADERPIKIYAVLAWMNDHGSSFAEIADWIDENVPMDD